MKNTLLGQYESRIQCRMLFVPRIKIRPREHSIGSFLRKSLLKPVALNAAFFKFKRYADLRKDKAAKIRRRAKPKKLNRWLSKRMFRGTGRNISIFRDFGSSKISSNSAPLSFTGVPLQNNDISSVDVSKGELSRQIHKGYYGHLHRRQK